jgi:hypothetical protein
MTDQKNYFDTLGLKPTASPEEIIKAHDQLMEYWNPDRVPDFYKQKALEGRDRIEEAYQQLMGLRDAGQRRTQEPARKPQELIAPKKPATDGDRAFIGTDRDGSTFYLDKKSIVVQNDRLEVSVNIYPPADSTLFLKAQACMRRAGYEGLECLVEKWGLGPSSKVFTKYGLNYKSRCGHLMEADTDTRKVWKPIASGSLEEKAWETVDGIIRK